ncbi:Mammalian cell entry related domain protein [Mycolicibacterium sp. ELW1-p]
MIHSGGRNPSGIISVTIDTPYVGEGVVAGTSVIMHGVKMGEVAAISRQPGGHVVLTTNLQAAPAVGLTDAMGIDFRPSNYFGVTGINLLPADTGQPLHDGIRLEITPKGNFALQTLLYQLGTLTNHVITQQLVDVIERTTRYTDALNPLLETMITVSTTVANVQTVGTAQLLRNATGINVALPGFVDALISTGDMYLHTKVGTAFNADEERTSNPFVGAYDSALLNQYNGAVALLASNPDEFVFGRLREWLKGAETDLFSKVGHLESSHVYELFPVVEEIRTLTDTIPKLIPAQDISNTLREVRERLERMYAGSGEQRALQVRLILDELPGLASPLGLALEAAG